MQKTSAPRNGAPSGGAATLSHDLFASLVVFLVAVPLALGIALASGAPLASGLIACIVGGIVAGSLGGAPLQVSGPAAGLTVIVFTLIQQHGWAAMCAITVVAGLMQLGLGSLRIARTCLAISPAVVHGMLAGIGIVIVLAQLHVLLGDAPESNALTNLKALPGEIRTIISTAPPARVHAALVGLYTLLILFAWGRMPKKVQQIPGALVAVVFATLICNFLWTDAPRVSIPEGSLFTFRWPEFGGNWGAILLGAVSVALVASVESLLCAVATDRMHDGPRAQLDRELMAQGATNTVSGLLGGLPVTGVIVRSSANITAGARTRLSAILHGIWILAFLLLASRYLALIPQAALAGLLVFIGLRLVNLNHIRELHKHNEALVYFVTVVGVAFWNLLNGVILGIVLAIVMLLRKLAVTNIAVEHRDGHWRVHVTGALTFVSVPQLTEKLAEIPPGQNVDVDLDIEFMDHAAFDALHGWRMTYQRMGGAVDIDELHEAWNENRNGEKEAEPRGEEAMAGTR